MVKEEVVVCDKGNGGVTQDYVNWIVRDLNQPEFAELDNADRLTTPR